VTTTATEFRLLHYLAQHAGRRLYPRPDPGRRLAGDHVRQSTSVDVYVRKLREKIEDDPERPRYLKTVRARATALKRLNSSAKKMKRRTVLSYL